MADIAALEADYYKAIENYEKVAKSSLNNNLMKWSVKEYYLKAGICHLATNVCFQNYWYLIDCILIYSQDMVGTARAIQSYQELDPTFAATRECQLLGDLSNAVEQGDQEAYADKLYQFDQMSKLDKWKTTLLLRVKDAIENKEEDFS